MVDNTMREQGDTRAPSTGSPLPAWLRGATKVIERVVAVRRGRRPETFPADEVGAQRIEIAEAAGWWMGADGIAPTVVLVHGYGAQPVELLPFARDLHAAGAHVLLVDDRTLPRPETDLADDPAESGPGRGLAKLLVWTRERADVGAIAVVGHSMGGSVSLGVVADDPADVVAVVTMGAVADPTTTRMAGIPAFLNKRAVALVERRVGFDLRARIGAGAIGRVEVPVLVVHGRGDRAIPPINADRLVAAGATAQLLLVDADHAPASLYASAGPLVTEYVLAKLGLA